MPREKKPYAESEFFKLHSSHKQSQYTEHELGEPHAEPVDVVLAVSQVIYLFSSKVASSNSLLDRCEFLAACQQQENSHGRDIQVEG